MTRPLSAMKVYADKIIEYRIAGRTDAECAAENRDLCLTAMAEWQYQLAVNSQPNGKGRVFFV